MNMTPEQVLVVKNEILVFNKDLSEAGLITEDRQNILDSILRDFQFMPRDIAEYNYEYKQVIPYVVISFKEQFLLLKRKSAQTEKRLHNKYSLGIGGHINPSTADKYENVIIEGLYRELNEEISIKDINSLEFIGVINDNSTDVSKVHLGLLYLLKMEGPDFHIIETEKMEGSLVSISNITEVYENLETWSQIVFDDFLKVLIPA